MDDLLAEMSKLYPEETEETVIETVNGFVEQVVDIVIQEEFEALLGYVQRLAYISNESFVFQFFKQFFLIPDLIRLYNMTNCI